MVQRIPISLNSALTPSWGKSRQPQAQKPICSRKNREQVKLSISGEHSSASSSDTAGDRASQLSPRDIEGSFVDHAADVRLFAEIWNSGELSHTVARPRIAIQLLFGVSLLWFPSRIARSSARKAVAISEASVASASATSIPCAARFMASSATRSRLVLC